MTEDIVRQRLGVADVQKLMADPSAKARTMTSEKLARQFSAGELSARERKIAEDIFRTLVKDAEVRVREALSSHLKRSAELPHDVALALARDVDSVALPMLKFSEVLTDQDLVEIVRSSGATHQVAVAQRARVSASVADALIDTGNETAVARLVSNDGAELTESALGRVMTEYQGSDEVSASLTGRPSLPANISAKLVEVVTQRLQDYLAAKHDLPADIASNLILQARERATMSLVEYGSSDVDLQNLVEQLHHKQRLTASLLLRAICMGDVGFFERAMARLAGVALQNARILIHDQGPLGLESLYLKAKLPKRLFPAFRVGIDLAEATDYDAGPNDRRRYIERMLERMLTYFEDPSARLSREDIDYLMGKLEQVAA